MRQAFCFKELTFSIETFIFSATGNYSSQIIKTVFKNYKKISVRHISAAITKNIRRNIKNNISYLNLDIATVLSRLRPTLLVRLRPAILPRLVPTLLHRLVPTALAGNLGTFKED
jgi:hypothetical protein